MWSHKVWNIFLLDLFTQVLYCWVIFFMFYETTRVPLLSTTNMSECGFFLTSIFPCKDLWFCPYRRIYGSEKSHVLAYFILSSERNCLGNCLNCRNKWTNLLSVICGNISAWELKIEIGFGWLGRFGLISIFLRFVMIRY